MKTPTDHIFQLINAMTASEKRYFKRHYSSDKSLITTLFDFINGQSEYDEEQVKKHFEQSKLSKNLKVYKVQLTDVLLKSLVSYHNKKSIHSKIRMGLEEIDILMDKQLFDIAQSKVKRIKDICIQHEAFEHIFPILAIEQSLISFYSANKDTSKLTSFQELNAQLTAVKTIFQLQHTSHQLSDMKNHILTNQLSEDHKTFYRNCLETELQLIDSTDTSIRESYYRYHVISMIYRMIEGDLEKENLYKNKQVLLLKENPKFTQAYPKLYFASMYNYLSSCWKLGKYSELEEGLSNTNTFIKENSVLEPNMLFTYYLETIFFYVKKLEGFDEQFEGKVIKHIRKYNQQGDYLSSLIYIHFAIFNLADSNYRRVHFFLRRFSENISTLDPAFESLLYIIELISHTQSGDLSVAQNLINAHLRKQKRNPSNNNTTFVKVTAFFQVIGKLNSAEEIKNKAIEFQVEYDSMTGSLRNLLDEYLFSDWLKSLINNEKLKTQITKKYSSISV